MKFRGIIKPKVKNVTDSFKSVIITLILLFFFFQTHAQEDNKYNWTVEQYEFVNQVYGENSKYSKKVYLNTEISKDWINEFLYDRNENGIGTCSFEESSFGVELDRLKEIKFGDNCIDKKKLPKKVTLIKGTSKKNHLNISQPIIINHYAFVYTLTSSYEAVEIYINDHSGWKFKCFSLLSGEL